MKKCLLVFTLLSTIPIYSSVQSLGVWAWGSTVRSVGVYSFVDEMHQHGVTDVLLLVKGVDGTYTFNTLDSLIMARDERGYDSLRIHAWVICFNDASWGGWVDPENESYKEYLLGTIISPLIREHDIDGLNLDCIRYPGTAEGNTEPITSFCAAVKETLIAAGKDSTVILSAAVMPEMSSNAYLYGQDYGDMGHYLDVLIPMSYTHNYYSSPRWVGSTVKYIVDELESEGVTDCEVWVALQSKDDNGVFASAEELLASIESALRWGATGFNYFVYPVTGEQYSVIGLFSVPVLADTTDTTAQPSDSALTYDEAVSICVNVADYIDENKRAPLYVSSSIGNLGMEHVFYIASCLTEDLCNGTPDTVYYLHLPNILPVTPTGEVYAEACTTYAEMAGNARSFIEENNQCPNYVTSEFGTVRFWEVLYMFCRVVRWFYQYGSDPGLAYIKPVPGFRTDAYEDYTQDSNNCTASNYDIKTKAMKIIESISNQANVGELAPDDAMYQAAEEIHYWVSNNKSYCFYYNTAYGAYNSIFVYDCINCCDHAHAVVGLARSIGIPALYRHAECWFGSSLYGHVWAYLYINGTSYHYGSGSPSAGWWDSDASMDLTFGDHKPINQDYNTYFELPFKGGLEGVSEDDYMKEIGGAR